MNFIEKIIEDDIQKGFPIHNLKFRFPPEPNGALHLGHVKAIYLNFYLGQKYQAPVNLRFDDTNPNLYDGHKYVEFIKNDIIFLGFKWDKECYASDYFQILYELARMLIKNDKAYVDNQTQYMIQIQRKNPIEKGINSIFRNRCVEENLYLFEKMKNGCFKEGTCVLRAKIDMSSSNMNMRDPIMYRILKKKHFRTKNTWCIYPTYDWTHGQCDYIEQISHSLCSSEFENRRPLYNWYLDQIVDKQQKIKPKQIEFSRLNLQNAITSKREIQKLIDKQIINSWNDPRIYTISGLRRKGYTAVGIKKFIQDIGVTKRNNVINISLLELKVRENLKQIAYRVMVIFNPIKLIIDNYPDNHTEWLYSQNHPDNIEFGFRKIPFSKFIYIEKNDFLEQKTNNFFRLSINQYVRLKNAYIIKAHSVIKDKIGNIIEIHCLYDPQSKSGTMNNNKYTNKIKSTLHWVSIAHSITIETYIYHKLFQLNNKYANLFDQTNINNQSIEKIIAYAEPILKNAKIGEHFQFQRIGYFYVVYENNKLIFNQTFPLKKNLKKINNKKL